MWPLMNQAYQQRLNKGIVERHFSANENSTSYNIEIIVLVDCEICKYKFILM